MSEESEVQLQEIYLAPDTNLNDDDWSICHQLACEYERVYTQKRQEEAAALQGLYPEIHAAQLVGTAASFHGLLEKMREVMVESIGDQPELNDSLLRLSGTIAASQTVIAQLHSILLNVYTVQQEILANDENVNAMIASMRKLSDTPEKSEAASAEFGELMEDALADFNYDINLDNLHLFE